MKNYLLTVLLISTIIFSSCKEEQDPFLISKQNIGFLTDSTQVKDLKTIFVNDSISKFIGGDEFVGKINDIEIFDATGKLLLVLTPSQSLDSTAVIKTIKIVDDRFKTEKGLNTKSTFKDIRDNYKISSIQNSIRSVIVSADEINAFFIIDKEELPSNMRFDMSLKIEALQIPAEAKIKNFFLQWN